jgi:hypothetical protein
MNQTNVTDMSTYPVEWCEKCTRRVCLTTVDVTDLKKYVRVQSQGQIRTPAYQVNAKTSLQSCTDKFGDYTLQSIVYWHFLWVHTFFTRIEKRSIYLLVFPFIQPFHPTVMPFFDIDTCLPPTTTTLHHPVLVLVLYIFL